MIIINDPLVWAKRRLTQEQDRLASINRTEVARKAGCFPTERMKREQRMACVVKINLLIELINGLENAAKKKG